MPKRKKSFKKSSFSNSTLIVYLMVFALAGLVIWRIFAATAPNPAISKVVPTLEAENMSLPSGAKVYSSSTASGGKAVKISKNNSAGLRATKTTGFNTAVLQLRAHDTPCGNFHPTIKVTVEAGGKTVSFTQKVNGKAWRYYKRSVSLPAGANVVRMNYGTYSKTLRCQAKLYVDMLRFYPKPTY